MVYTYKAININLKKQTEESQCIV